MKDFVDSHWRDLVGIFILVSGIGITLLRAELSLGPALVMSGLTSLKLTTKTKGGPNVQT